MTVNKNQLVPVKRELLDALQKPAYVKMLKELKAKGVEEKAFAQKAYFAITKNPKLLACDHGTILRSVAASVLVGLDCTGTLGQGYLVPFAKECVFIIGYQGLIELARRSGHINRIEARPVYEKDEFQIVFGNAQVITHTPCLTGDRGKMICAYAIADIKDGGEQIEIMRTDEIDVIKMRSPSGGSGPWKTDYSEMARKTVVRRLIKYIPKSPDLVKAVKYEEGEYDFDPHEAIPVESEVVPPVTERIKKEIAEKDKKKTGKKAKPKEKVAPQTSAEPSSAQPSKATTGEKDSSESAGSGEMDPAPSEVPVEEPESEAEPAKLKYRCKCGREFEELKDGNMCPFCFSKKVTERI